MAGGPSGSAMDRQGCPQQFASRGDVRRSVMFRVVLIVVRRAWRRGAAHSRLTLRPTPFVQLLAEAGYPKGFDAGEAVVNYLQSALRLQTR